MSTTFSERLKELRQELKLSQAGFASLISTNQSTLSAYETGDRLPPYETLITIAQQCHVSIDWLCGLSDTKSTSPELKTYSDLIKVLMLIEEAPEIVKAFCLDYHSVQSFMALPYNTLRLDINDKHIVEFYEEWKEILSIRRKSPSGEKLYSIWLKDIYERYNFPLEDASQSSGDDDLPFN